MAKIKDILSDDMPQGAAVTVEPLENLFHYWKDPETRLNWDCLFVLPPWLKVWWASFGRGRHQFICSVRLHGELTGVAPLMLEGETAHIIGGIDLCDYGDFIMVPGMERFFLSFLFARLRREGIRRLEMGTMREGSSTLSFLNAQSGLQGFTVSCKRADDVFRLRLPDSWEQFLSGLSGKERHELRRKEKRLFNAGRISFREVEKGRAVPSSMDIFIHLFRLNRPDKSRFMTVERERFFRLIAEEMSGAGLLRLFFLEIDKRPVASVMCFDYHSTVYLYNNGYDARFSSFSVGLLSKAFSIRDSISRGRKEYDFLKGGEPYKRRLGSTPSQLVRCKVILN